MDILGNYRDLLAVPTIELDEIELTEAARGARCLAAQAQADAERQGSSSSREIFERSVRYHEAMARKSEQTRSSNATSRRSVRSETSR
jgi:hypothetical protein